MAKRRLPLGATLLPVPSPTSDDDGIWQALRDWRSGQAYIDGDGNYRLRPVQVGDHKWQGSGPVAPWNRAAKRRFASCSELHAAAHEEAA